MKISSTGHGLNIVIGCNYQLSHNWMSYICWYSLIKNLPDAKVMIACNRKLMKNSLFVWTRKCKVPFVLHKETDEFGQIEAAGVSKPLLFIPPEAICIRDFDEAGFSPNVWSEEKSYFLNDELICDCKEDKSCVFATYLNGWGRFVTPEWINRSTSPFIQGVRYDQGQMTANEIRIGRLWNAATLLFQTVSRG